MGNRGPSIQHKIRKTTVNNKTGDNFSITIPRVLAEKFEGVFFKLSISGNDIHLQSGCKISLTDLKVLEEKDYIGNYKQLERAISEGGLINNE